MKIHHIGYAVKDLENSIKEFGKLGYNRVEKTITDKKRKVLIQFMKNAEYLIELVAPLNKESPITNMLKTQGNSPYHICYETNDIDSKIMKLNNDGFAIITKLLGAPAIDNKKVIFLYKKNMGLIELIEK